MQNKEPKVITKITVKGKEYYLLNDGKLYEKGLDDKYILLEGVDEESKKIIEKIMERFKPAQTDVIRDGEEKKQIIFLHYLRNN